MILVASSSASSGLSLLRISSINSISFLLISFCSLRFSVVKHLFDKILTSQLYYILDYKEVLIMKDKLMGALGAVGFILWLLLSILVYVLPFVMIGASFWVNLILFGIVYFFPPSSIVFWIWGLVCAIQGVQDIWAIIYYVLFAIAFVPFFISTILELFATRRSKEDEDLYDDSPDQDIPPGALVNWRD